MTFFTFRFVTVKSTYSIIIFFVTIPQDPTCYTYIKMTSFETLWDPGYANRISNLNENNITNSQWRAIQLAWLAHWVKHCVRSSQRSGTFSTTRIISTIISLSAVHNMSHFIYFHSCHSPHREYYDLTMAWFPVSFISLMDKALRPVFVNVRVRFQVKPKIFSVLIQPLTEVVYSTARIISWNFKQFGTFNSWGNVDRPTNRNARGNNIVHF